MKQKRRKERRIFILLPPFGLTVGSIFADAERGEILPGFLQFFVYFGLGDFALLALIKEAVKGHQKLPGVAVLLFSFVRGGEFFEFVKRVGQIPFAVGFVIEVTKDAVNLFNVEIGAGSAGYFAPLGSENEVKLFSVVNAAVERVAPFGNAGGSLKELGELGGGLV